MIPKVKLLQRLLDGGVIAVIRRVPGDKMIPLAESLIEGGVTALEVTLDHPDALSSIRTLSAQLKSRAIVGAGTVIDSASATMAIHHGAEFIFSPSLHQDAIKTALRYGKVAVPGVMTPSEMITAMEWGADMVKIFPASGLGVKYIKDVKGPLSHIPVIPTGGVNLENVSSYIEAGVAAVGVGGNLVNLKLIEEGNFKKITESAKQYVHAVQEARGMLIR
ncbi:bifunctional 4-hydroxy-2-oxoglutarate aldolase/2-dehydro-3-deoxy-phosphogluconate aldolase [Bacillus ginsengihumi]|uniref:2-dehydro-3-deoxyphosphogluconate aldolase n=1 Tax=Heyndrickxia ginsengihumi TaxID=363870 RepID=A0A0A6VG41_9BACI|nr:bifunctional 4-hydroxy-2-oxoglutarate aldolase/2-dehydro-3-deoxy-phosphogluconate aldolase [Heyndrickxia ginsengihumi]KHD85594.1 2-dehydro-3-deoxyphosphogluconate aldolase [Heyndrickxia ginsengihumi]MBE6183634.1 bifunctional 4-hydroxy-2-oxoglutarate aldolase/2-dehydro-3-deoxy-phosphogluconate aldolase [Bacillus sp. (in: firmicutes)]MCM3023075.1 bifunctional 4-hydroxy-2-oxoglutarate aldolase/2-dehydro-3-deoxy-phosphogluconate aldolase [Heyndrickxia ginsengihumi]NEY19545.1 bifunctional 4-hydro